MAASCTWWKQSCKSEEPPALSALLGETQSWLNTEIWTINSHSLDVLIIHICKQMRGQTFIYGGKATPAVKSHSTKLWGFPMFMDKQFYLKHQQENPNFIRVVWVMPNTWNASLQPIWTEGRGNASWPQLNPSPLSALEEFLRWEPPTILVPADSHKHSPASKSAVCHLLQITASSGVRELTGHTWMCSRIFPIQ